MNKKYILRVLGFVAACATINPLLGQVSTKKNIIIKNNSMWKIDYTFTPAQTPVLETGVRVLLPGEYITLDADQPVSIRRVGILASEVSSWVDVPKLEDLIQQLSAEKAYKYNLGLFKKNPIINIGTSLTGGWSFNLGLK